VALPEVHLHERGARFSALMKATAPLAPIRTAVVHPCDDLSLKGALEAGAQDMIVPVLIGPRVKIEAVAREMGRDLTGIDIVDVPHSHAAAETAARAMALNVFMMSPLRPVSPGACMRQIPGDRCGRRGHAGDWRLSSCDQSPQASRFPAIFLVAAENAGNDGADDD